MQLRNQGEPEGVSTRHGREQKEMSAKNQVASFYTQLKHNSEVSTVSVLGFCEAIQEKVTN